MAHLYEIPLPILSQAHLLHNRATYTKLLRSHNIDKNVRGWVAYARSIRYQAGTAMLSVDECEEDEEEWRKAPTNWDKNTSSHTKKVEKRWNVYSKRSSPARRKWLCDMEEKWGLRREEKSGMAERSGTVSGFSKELEFPVQGEENWPNRYWVHYKALQAIERRRQAERKSASCSDRDPILDLLKRERDDEGEMVSKMNAPVFPREEAPSFSHEELESSVNHAPSVRETLSDSESDSDEEEKDEEGIKYCRQGSRQKYGRRIVRDWLSKLKKNEDGDRDDTSAATQDRSDGGQNKRQNLSRIPVSVTPLPHSKSDRDTPSNSLTLPSSQQRPESMELAKKARRINLRESGGLEEKNRNTFPPTRTKSSCSRKEIPSEWRDEEQTSGKARSNSLVSEAEIMPEQSRVKDVGRTCPKCYGSASISPPKQLSSTTIPESLPPPPQLLLPEVQSCLVDVERGHAGMHGNSVASRPRRLDTGVSSPSPSPPLITSQSSSRRRSVVPSNVES